MDYGIFNVRTDVNACDCTRGCTETLTESAHSSFVLLIENDYTFNMVLALGLFSPSAMQEMYILF